MKAKLIGATKMTSVYVVGDGSTIGIPDIVVLHGKASKRTPKEALRVANFYNTPYPSIITSKGIDNGIGDNVDSDAYAV